MASMSAPNKHQQRTEQTRRKLLEAGLRIFVRDGFEAARIEDIAAASGHTRGAFYANFETKEDLFLALLEQQSVKRITELHAILERHKAGDEITFKVLQNGQTRDVKVKLDPPKE